MHLRPLTEADLPATAALGRFLGPPRADGFAIDGPGGLIAAGWLREGSGAEGLRLHLDGAVDGRHRGRGLGARLLAALEAEARRRAAGRAGVLRIDVADRSPAAAALYRAQGFALAVQEVEMARPTEPGPAPDWPAGIEALPWRDDLAPQFHAAWHDAFRERPGFPGWDCAAWAGAYRRLPPFRPDLSRLLRVGDRPLAFLMAGAEGGEGIVFQMGVRPEARGRGLAESLLRRALADFAAIGLARAVLEVATNNARAARLYARLGFQARRTVEGWKKAL
ncbi:MAG TPA: GNAT family N-acetyltransferase [Alphaproteobacteria bacterium]|nr:GNAT family N-acetyltransferase [Alphaproteobacteria bacterium]